jgi:hypothetical protein
MKKIVKNLIIASIITTVLVTTTVLVIRGKVTKIKGPTKYSEAIEHYNGYITLTLFPASTTVGEEDELFYFRRKAIFDPYYQFYVKCDLTKSKFDAEVARLDRKAAGSGRISIEEDEQGFWYKQETNYNHIYSYALVSKSDNTIVYVYLQFIKDKEINFDKKFLIPTFESF